MQFKFFLFLACLLPNIHCYAASSGAGAGVGGGTHYDDTTEAPLYTLGGMDDYPSIARAGAGDGVDESSEIARGMLDHSVVRAGAGAPTLDTVGAQSTSTGDSFVLGGIWGNLPIPDYLSPREASTFLFAGRGLIKDIRPFIPIKTSFFPSQFVEWSEGNSNNPFFFLHIDVPFRDPLTPRFWDELKKRAPFVLGLFFNNLDASRYYKEIPPFIDLNPLTNINFSNLRKFSIFGLNPGSGFFEKISTSSLMQYVSHLKFRGMGSREINSLMQSHRLRNLQEFDVEYLSESLIIQVIARSPYIRLRKIGLNLCTLSHEDAILLKDSEALERVKSLFLYNIETSEKVGVILDSPNLPDISRLKLSFSKWGSHDLIESDKAIRAGLPGSEGWDKLESDIALKLMELSTAGKLQNITHFWWNGAFTEKVANWLVRSPFWPNIRHLSITSSLNLDGFKILAASATSRFIEHLTIEGHSLNNITGDAIRILSTSIHLQPTSLYVKGNNPLSLEEFKGPGFSKVERFQLGESISSANAAILVTRAADILPALTTLYPDPFLNSFGPSRAALERQFTLVDKGSLQEEI